MPDWLSTKSYVPEGDAGTEATLRAMRRMIDKGTASPRVIRIARDIVRPIAARDTDAEAHAILNWVQAKLRYTHDPVGVEVVADPDYMAREYERTGSIVEDCDGAVVMIGALLKAVGIEAEPVVVSPDEGSYSHVLIRYKSPKHGYVTLDGITKNGPGWFPSGAVRVGVFRNGRIDPDSPVTVQGLSGYPDGRIPEGNGPVDFIQRASARVEPVTNIMWFVLGVAAVWKWAKTGKAPL